MARVLLLFRAWVHLRVVCLVYLGADHSTNLELLRLVLCCLYYMFPKSCCRSTKSKWNLCCNDITIAYIFFFNYCVCVHLCVVCLFACLFFLNKFLFILYSHILILFIFFILFFSFYFSPYVFTITLKLNSKYILIILFVKFLCFVH